eukprot:Tbor_TRINITY_DN4657_c0_g1::TRINITY_DN4657_c0_g1_i1::g.14810::m.14810/K04043/dnaK, HSPA9; molecular chaperone DnaK
MRSLSVVTPVIVASVTVRHFSSIATKMGTSDIVIGVDLGTTFSCVAVMDGETPRILENSEGSRTTPSVVGFTKTGEKLVGGVAKRQSVTNPASTFFAVKRLIGRRFNDEHIQKDIKNVPYKIVRSNNGDAWVQDGNGKQYSPSQVAAFILEKLKDTAENHLHKKISNAVITCPAYFNDAQRQATKDAGRIAGLNVHRVINEPTAAALAYGIDRKKECTIAVYDLGGGTFDISILEINGGVFEVKATNGDTHLGGEDFDLVLSDYIVSEFKKNNGIDIAKDPMALQRIREAAEKAKRELSSAEETEINLPFISNVGSNGPLHVDMSITRDKFNELTDSLIQRTLKPCKQALKDADVNLNELTEVVMVGGMTRMPKVLETVKTFFKKEPFKGVNPDEAVAVGAAIQGGVLRGSVTGLIMVDVTPLSLGIEVVGGIFSRIIPKNTVIPCKRTQTYTTLVDGQTDLVTKVYQGEREVVSENQLLGQFNLNGIPVAPKGVPQIDVTFDLDASGICNVTAKDQASGKSQRITVSANGGLSKDDIERMIRDSEQHAMADKARIATANVKNEAESNIYTAESSLTSWKHVSDVDKQKAKELIAVLRKTIANGSSTNDEIKQASDKLHAAIMEGGRTEYQANAAANK